MFLHNEDCFTADGRDANPLRVLDGLLRGYDRRSTPHRHQGAGAATLVWTELYIASLGSINTDNMVSCETLALVSFNIPSVPGFWHFCSDLASFCMDFEYPLNFLPTASYLTS